MARLSAKLRSVAFDRSGTRAGIAFWCPGCGESHAVPTRDPAHRPPLWTWDGSVDVPTLAPSVLITGDRWENGRPRPTRCHSFVRAGRIEFLGDCTHALVGRTVDLPDWPAGGGEDTFYLDSFHVGVRP